MCFIASIPEALQTISNKQCYTLTSQKYDIINATNDNLLNEMHPLSFATGHAENEVFHLRQMLK